MIGKQSVARPTALGTLLQSSAYGATIPSGYGTPRMAPLWIWAANLRQGGSGKKLKNKKKGITTYVENVDGLIGSNPITGVLQIWANQKDQYPLDFKCYRFAANAGGSWNSTVTIPDSRFYAVIAVTIQCGLVTTPFTFTDFGAQGPSTYYGPYNYYEFPLWNAAHHGPDLSDPNLARFPYFIWAPSDGPTILVPEEGILERIGNLNMPNPGSAQAPFGQDFIYNIYYAATTSATSFKSPLARNRLTFESQLGSGSEYSDAGLPSQRIIYPPYAGIESDSIDLGATGALPSLRLEVQASYGFLPSILAGVAVYGGPTTIDNVGARADAEYADIIEDVIKSGMMQYGAELGYIQRGCNCSDLPGPVQKAFGSRNGDWSPAPMIFTQPNKTGSILIAAVNSDNNFGNPAPTVSDTDGNVWITALADAAVGGGPGAAGFFYVNGCVPSGNRNTVNLVTGGEGVDAFILEMDPGSTAIDGAPVVISIPAGKTINCAIKASGRPSYIMAFILSGGDGFAAYPSPQWTRLFPQEIPSWSDVYGRKASAPGTYYLKVQASGTKSVRVVLFAVLSSQAAGTVPYPKALGNIVDYNSLWNVRLQCRAGGLQGSLSMDSQRKASDWLKDLYQCANAAPVWSGFTLKSIARSEVSQVGDGSLANVNNTDPANLTFGGLAAVYWAPTSTGPVADLGENDFIGDTSAPVLSVDRKAQVDSNNIVQVQYLDRNNKYNQATASEPEAGAIALYGPRKLAPQVLNMISSSTVARKINAIAVRRKVYIRNTYSFKLHSRYLWLEAMDLVTITDPKIGISKLPVRLTKIAENESYELECEAEPYFYGLHSPDIVASTPITPNSPNTGAVPANVNTPIIFEPPLRMCLSGKPELWFVVSDSDPNYGGCVVYASTDGGTTYKPIGTITGNAATGVLTADFPAAADPDTADTLSVDLTESLGTLGNFDAADEASFSDPIYLASSPLYELGAYRTATLTAANKYNIVGASGNPIRRAVFGMPAAGMGVDHPISSRFAFLDSREAAVVPGILKLQLDPAWIGQTIHFKFVGFNTFQGGQQDISTVTDYTYAPAGIGTGNSGSGSGVGAPSQPAYTITGGALTQPTPTTIQMAAATVQYPGSTVYLNARTFTIAAPTAPTKYYVTIADPNQTGDIGSALTLTGTCQTSNALVGVPGNVYIGSITAIAAGGGTGTGSGGFPIAPSGSLVIGFVINSGATGTNVGPEFAAPRAGTISKCKVVTKASDGSVDLTFKIKQNGVDVFSADPTVAHGTAAGTVSTFTALTSTPLTVAPDDVFTIDITGGSSSWIVTIQLET